MSRIGNRKLVIPEGVTITEENNVVTVKGPKGELTTKLAENITIKVEGNTLEVLRSNDNTNTKTMHGTINALINNMMTGVTKGFEKGLEIIRPRLGVMIIAGWQKPQLKGKILKIKNSMTAAEIRLLLCFRTAAGVTAGCSIP